MNKTRFTHSTVLSLILCLVLIAAVALTAWGCNEQNNTEGGTEAPETQSVTETESESHSESDTQSATEAETTDPNAPTVKGEGNTAFFFNVVDKDGNVTKFDIRTDKTTVGEALLELGLIEGEDGDYGLYVKKVNGILADWDVDQTYWAFYVNGDYGLTGVDTTEIVAGETYEFRVSK